MPHLQVPSLMLVISNDPSSVGKATTFTASLYDAPMLRNLDVLEAGSGLPRADSDDDALLKVCDLPDHSGRVLDIMWDPLGISSQIVTVDDGAVYAWGIDSGGTIKPKKKRQFDAYRSLFAVDWDHHVADHLMVGATSAALGYDLRSDSITCTLEHAHDGPVRQVKFNPNRRYFVATGADDGAVNLWDTRNSSKPFLTCNSHSHWLTAMAFNPFHDQLLLTASTDAFVNLWRLPSVSSEVEKTEEEAAAAATPSKNSKKKQQAPAKDALLRKIEEHENAVSSVAWSAHSPWVFVSLSIDGRVLFHNLPQEEKYRILL
eukprot:ANDGO_02064.mRNA.2 Protein tssc1 homolog